MVVSGGPDRPRRGHQARPCCRNRTQDAVV